MSEIQIKSNELTGEKYYYSKHSSGLRVYFFPKSMSTTYAIFGTHYGSMDNKFRHRGESEWTEVPDGIAHFLEHKMFEQEDGTDAFESYAKTGASANAYTSFNMTNYLFSTTENFYESLEILLDFVSHPYFTQKTVDKEQGIIGQEIKMGEDDPSDRLFFEMLKNLYEKHPLRNEIAGTVESISKIDADLLYRCYNLFYNLNNMILCICGEAEMDKILELCDKILKKSPEFDIESVYPEEEPRAYREYSEVKMEVAKPIFNIGVKIPSVPADSRPRMKERAAFSILNEILFGKGGDFFNELYSEKLITKPLGYFSSYSKQIALDSVSGESDNPAEVYSRFKTFISDIKSKGLDREDFERCKRVMYASFIKAFDSTENIVNSFVDFIYDDCDLLDYGEIIAGVSFEDAEELLRRIFKEEMFAMAVVSPLEG